MKLNIESKASEYTLEGLFHPFFIFGRILKATIWFDWLNRTNVNLNPTQADSKWVRGKSHTVSFPTKRTKWTFRWYFVWKVREEIYVNSNFSWLFVTIYIFSGILIFPIQLFPFSLFAFFLFKGTQTAWKLVRVYLLNSSVGIS